MDGQERRAPIRARQGWRARLSRQGLFARALAPPEASHQEWRAKLSEQWLSPRPLAPPTSATCLPENPFYTGVSGHNNGNNTITVTKTTTVNGNPSLR